MEIRNYTPNVHPQRSFGNFLKPSREAMQLLENMVTPEALKAYIEKQKLSKYFDIKTELADSYFGVPKRKNCALRFIAVPKEGVDTLGHNPRSSGWHSEGNYTTHSEEAAEFYNQKMQEYTSILNNPNIKIKCRTIRLFIINKIYGPMLRHELSKALKDLPKKHPEEMVPPALRRVADEICDLEAEIDRSKGMSDLFEAN